MKTLDPFYLIIDDASWLPRFLRLGVRFFQLRIKDKAEPELREQICRARDLCARAGAVLVVNDYWQIAIDEDCDFIHLGQEDLETADLPAIRRHDVKLGISTHDEAELDRALSASPDYIALGPVFPTILKQMPWAPQGLPRVTDWKRRVGSVPLVAIGGLTPERGRAVLEAGADSAAVVTDVLLNNNPEARAAEWLAETAPWRRSRRA
ncbi:thiamine phosphate synthase [Acidisoma cellulosilytica]|uniref:Thiamine phosphate synthase n=1 Tax=Acidisoma cellulosilyticum TaxID=2802395 RepID=A0A964E2G7_9PROT|nr:thiamine phosphate synthase [Acidisoma cellulosilyticum]MCB8879600.1 thiamine phosphate synthase [Acidisoma cellulosilyticum]